MPCLPANTLAVAISGVQHGGHPPGSNEGLSGITYADGTQYYAVDDSGGLMQSADIVINLTNGTIAAASFYPAVHLGGSDLEGIAYNAAVHSVFVSDETGATIKEYGLADTNYLSSVAVPAVFSNYRANFSLESLTIRRDGLEMDVQRRGAHHRWPSFQRGLWHNRSPAAFYPRQCP